METGLEIEHVWHADRGFRQCTILNRQSKLRWRLLDSPPMGIAFLVPILWRTYITFARPGYFSPADCIAADERERVNYAR